VKLVPGAGNTRRLIVLCCLLAAVGVAAPIVWAMRDHERRLIGMTEQGHTLELVLDEDGRLRGVETHIDAVCRGGHPWGVDWSPRESDARITQRDGRVAVRELVSRADQRVLVRLTGRVEGRVASGTVRVFARFYSAGQEVQACESGPRRWTAGDDAAARLAEAPPMREPRGRSYGLAPSLAGKVSPSRRRFIEKTDQTCLATYGPARAAYEAVQAAAGDIERQTEAFRAYVEAHADQLRALEGLGRPRDGAALHERWLANFRLRVRLERRLLRLAEAGRLADAAAINRRLGPLKMEGNKAGQQFGLRICTSNGPDRTPVPR
jgi:hypothetical protein